MTHYKDQTVTMILWMWITFVWAGPTFICICQRVSAAAAWLGPVQVIWSRSDKIILRTKYSYSVLTIPGPVHYTAITLAAAIIICWLVYTVCNEWLQFSFYGFPLSTNFSPHIVCRCHRVCCRAAIVPGRVSWPIIGCPDNNSDAACSIISKLCFTDSIVTCFSACYMDSVNNCHL